MNIRLVIAILCCNLIVLASLGNSAKPDQNAKAGLYLSNRFQILQHDADSIDPSVENTPIEAATKRNKPSKKRRLQMQRREERQGSTSGQLFNMNELISDLASGKDDVQIVPVSEQSKERDVSPCTASNEAAPKMSKKMHQNDSEQPTTSHPSAIAEEYVRSYPADDVKDQQHIIIDQEKKAKRNRKKHEQRQRRKDKLPNEILTWLNEEPERSSLRPILVQMLTSAMFPNLDSSSSRSSPDDDIDHSVDITCESLPISADNFHSTPTVVTAAADLSQPISVVVSRFPDGFAESEQEVHLDQPQHDNSSFADESSGSPSFNFLRQTDTLQFVEGLRDKPQWADARVQRLKRHLKKRKRPVSDDQPIWRKRSESIADEGAQTLNSIVQEPLSIVDEETQTLSSIVQEPLSIADKGTHTKNSIDQESQEVESLESTESEPKVVMGIQILENVTTDQKVEASASLWSHWCFKLIAVIIPTFILLSLLVVFIRRYQERQRRLSVLDSNILFTNQPKADSINMESDNEDNLFSNSTNMLRRGGIRINY